MEQFALKANGNDTLIGHSWEVENATANVVIFQGMEEHGLRYADFAEFFNKNSMNVYALDCYGQGANVGEDYSKMGIWDENGFDKMVDAYHSMVLEANKNGLKTHIFSHSMGSFMCQKFIQKYPGCVERTVLCGTGSKKSGITIAIALAKHASKGDKRNQKASFLNNMMFGSFPGSVKNRKTDFDWLSYNEENVKRYIDDPLCGFVPSNGFCYEFLVGMHSLYTKKGLNSIDKNQKIFLISGEEDVVTGFTKRTEIMYKLYKSLGIKDVEKKIYPHARHEILFEECREVVFNDILNFFTK